MKTQAGTYSVRPKKSLGQHFLVCLWVTDTIIDAAELSSHDTVIEIGPGTGALTRVAASRVKRLIAVEKDERLADQLTADLQKEGIDNVEVVKGDILRVLKSPLTLFQSGDFAPSFIKGRRAAISLETCKLPATTYKLVGNIPYYLTGRLMRLVFETAHKPSRIVFTIQKEVAERIVAEPPSMSILALSVQAFGHPHIIKRVPPGCFSPPPDVESAIISISDISGC